MANSCIYIPTIKVGNTQVESALFKDTLILTNNRDVAKQIWAISQVPEILKSLPDIQYDKNGEPTIESMDKALDIKSMVKSAPLNAEKLALNAISKDGSPVYHTSVEDIIDKVIDFNKANPHLVANINSINSKYLITVDYKTEQNSEDPNKLMFNNNLNNNLRGIMRRLGFDVTINDTLQGKGLFSPENAYKTAEGLYNIIQIVNGKLGEEAFPEEFSHLIIEGLSGQPLVIRLVNSLSEDMVKNILKDEYDYYDKLYKGNITLLQKEAAGKLLQSHIVSGERSNTSLVSRLWNYVRNIFKRLSDSDVQKAINDANQGFARLASAVMDESILPLFDKVAALEGPELHSVAEKNNKLQNLAEQSLELMSKRMKILQLRSKDIRYKDADVSTVKNLQDLIAKKKYTQSTMFFLGETLFQIEQLNKQLHNLKTSDLRADSDLSKIAKLSAVLRSIQEFSTGYTPIIKDLINMDVMQENGEVEMTPEDAKIISEQAANISVLIAKIEASYKSARFNVVFNFLKLYWGEDKILQIGKHKGEILSLELLLKEGLKDINLVDRYLTSMNDASDPILSLISKVAKVTQAHRDSILQNIVSEIRTIADDFMKSGHTTDFMYERNAQGITTGRLISDIDFQKYEKERAEFIEELNKQNLESYQRRIKIEKWEALRTESVILDIDTDRREVRPRKELYPSDALTKLTEKQLEFYQTMMQAKSYLDLLLPSTNVFTYNAVQIRDDLIESIPKNITDPKKLLKLVVENIKDKLLRRSDDTEYGENSKYGEFGLDSTTKIMTDFSNKSISKLPVYFTHPLEDSARLSTDFIASMMAYAGMAVNYNEMNKIIDVLELTKDLINDREVQQTSGNSKLVTSFKVINKLFTKAYTEQGKFKNIGGRLDDYYASVFYGKQQKDAGSITIGKTEFDINKGVKVFKKYTSVINLALNPFIALNNVVMGKMQLWIEAISMEYFNKTDYIKAGLEYNTLLPSFLGEINSIQKSNMLALLMDKFDPMADFYEKLKRDKYYQSVLARILGKTSVYFMQSFGEFYLHSRTMLAMLNAYKVKDATGKEISLYEALEVSKSNANTQNSGSYFLKVKDGVTQLDGSQVTENDLMELKLKIIKVNASLNGAFNAEDKGAIHRYALGTLAIQFRQWMPEHYNRRYARHYISTQLEQEREGYYRTAGRFILDLMKDIKRANFEIATHWHELKMHEKANIRRAVAELVLFGLMSLLIGLIGPVKDLKNHLLERFLAYQLYRVRLETGASVPINTDFLTNLGQIAQSPMPAIKPFNNLLNIFEFWNYNKEIESGRYRGWTYLERDALTILPFYGTATKVKDLSTEDYMFNTFK